MTSVIAPERAQQLKRDACERIDARSARSSSTFPSGFGRRPTSCSRSATSGWLADLLRASGYDVQVGVGGLETAFTATRGSASGPTVGIFSEFDALPEIGHGCGHNLLAISGVGAGLGLAAVANELPGRVKIHGKRAEEGGSARRSCSSSPNPYVPGGWLTYAIVVTNQRRNGASLTDTISAGLSQLAWTCDTTEGSACQTSTGTGSLTNALVNVIANR